MPVQVEQEQIDHSRVVLTVQVPPENYQKAVEAVFSQFAKRTSIPGFRPGKAPKHLVKRFISEDQVKDMALERALTDAFREAVRQSGVHPYSEAEPSVELPDEEFNPEEGFSFKATLALQPHVHLGSLDGLQGRLVKTTVTDEDVTRELDRYRESAATYEVTDEAAEEGDRVRATAQVSIDGETVPDLTFTEPTLFQIGANLDEFDAGLRGIREDEERTFDFSFPEEVDDEELRGKKATATVKADRVLRRTVPEADDALAQGLGYENLEALREQIRTVLQAQADAMAESEMMDSLIQDVVRASTVHYPAEMVDQEVSSRMDNLLAALQRRNFTLDDYLAAEKTDLVTFQQRLRQDSEQAIANTLTLLELARENHIHVTEKDVEAEIKRRAEAENVKLSQMRRLLAETDEISNIQNRIFRQKVAEFLKGKAEIREIAG